MNQKRGKVATWLLFLASFISEGLNVARWGVGGRNGERAREELKRANYGLIVGVVT